MTDVAASEAPLSTTLDPNATPGVSGGGTPAPDKVEEPTDLRSIIADEMKKDEDAPKSDKPDKPEEDGEAKGEKAEADDKGKPEPKEKAEADDVKPDEAKESEKPAKPAETKEKADDKPDDKPGHYQPPKNFLPDSREKWTNVPRPVQRDIDNLVRESEAKVQQLEQQSQRYESLREFDELAKSNGRDLKESLAKMSEIEDLMQANPYAGLNAILQEIGPKRPDGSAPSLFDVAQYITQAGPEKWQQMVGARPQANNDQQQPNPEVAELRQQILQMQTQQTASSVIEPFKAAHPRYDELKDDIALFLKSGKVSASLSPSDRLAAAYDMAERINPPSDVEAPASQTSPDDNGRADTDLSGTKSIKSAPGSSSPDLAPDRGGSIRELLSDEFRRKRA